MQGRANRRKSEPDRATREKQAGGNPLTLTFVQEAADSVAFQDVRIFGDTIGSSHCVVEVHHVLWRLLGTLWGLGRVLNAEDQQELLEGL